MAIPRMCDVCEKMAPSDGRDDLRMHTNLPKGWFYVGATEAGKSDEESAEVCSSKCAVKFIKGVTAMDVTSGSEGSGHE